MNFISKRCVIKIPSEICIIYSKHQNGLLIKSKKTKVFLRLTVKLLVLKSKNMIIVTNQLVNTIPNKLICCNKTIQGIAVSKIKQAFVDVQMVNYKKLKLIGVGYKAFELQSANNNFLHLKLGFSHSLYYRVPSNINIKILQTTKLFISGYNLGSLSQCASVIRKCKIPEPYKGKGILYSNEIIKLKEGKKV